MSPGSEAVSPWKPHCVAFGISVKRCAPARHRDYRDVITQNRTSACDGVLYGSPQALFWWNDNRIKISVQLWLSTTILIEWERLGAFSRLPWCTSEKAWCISHFRGAFWKEAWCIDRNRGASPVFVVRFGRLGAISIRRIFIFHMFQILKDGIITKSSILMYKSFKEC